LSIFAFSNANYLNLIHRLTTNKGAVVLVIVW